MVVRRDSSRGVSAVGIFLYFGTAMACLAGTTLIWRGTALDRVWILNAPAYRHLAPLGRIVGGFSFWDSAHAAGTGWFRRRLWGWRLAVGIITTLVLGGLLLGLLRLPLLSPLQPNQRPDWLTPDVILILFLPALVFEDSIKIDVRQLIRDSVPLLLLANIGVVLAALVTGYLVH